MGLEQMRIWPFPFERSGDDWMTGVSKNNIGAQTAMLMQFFWLGMGNPSISIMSSLFMIWKETPKNRLQNTRKPKRPILPSLSGWMYTVPKSAAGCVFAFLCLFFFVCLFVFFVCFLLFFVVVCLFFVCLFFKTRKGRITESAGGD